MLSHITKQSEIKNHPERATFRLLLIISRRSPKNLPTALAEILPDLNVLTIGSILNCFPDSRSV